MLLSVVAAAASVVQCFFYFGKASIDGEIITVRVRRGGWACFTVQGLEISLEAVQWSVEPRWSPVDIVGIVVNVYILNVY